MHPNLIKNSPLQTQETSTRMNLIQGVLVLGTWVALFAIGYTLLP